METDPLPIKRSRTKSIEISTGHLDKSAVQRLSREELQEKYLELYHGQAELKRQLREEKNSAQNLSQVLHKTRDQLRQLQGKNGATAAELRATDQVPKLEAEIVRLERANTQLKNRLTLMSVNASPTRSAGAGAAAAKSVAAGGGGTKSQKQRRRSTGARLSKSARSADGAFETEMLRDKLHEKEEEMNRVVQQLQSELAASRAQSNSSSGRAQLLQEDLEKIRLQRQVREQAAVAAEWQIRCETESERSAGLQQQASAASMQLQRLQQQLHEAQTQLQQQQQSGWQQETSQMRVKRLQVELDEAGRETQVLKDSNDKFISSAFDTQRERQWQAREASLKQRIVELEQQQQLRQQKPGTAAAEAAAAASPVRGSASQEAEQLEQELSNLRVKYFELQLKHEQLQEKSRQFERRALLAEGLIQQQADLGINLHESVDGQQQQQQENTTRHRKQKSAEATAAESEMELQRTQDLLQQQRQLCAQLQAENRRLKQQQQQQQHAVEEMVKPSAANAAESAPVYNSPAHSVVEDSCVEQITGVAESAYRQQHQQQLRGNSREVTQELTDSLVAPPDKELAEETELCDADSVASFVSDYYSYTLASSDEEKEEKQPIKSASVTEEENTETNISFSAEQHEHVNEASTKRSDEEQVADNNDTRVEEQEEDEDDETPHQSDADSEDLVVESVRDGKTGDSRDASCSVQVFSVELDSDAKSLKDPQLQNTACFVAFRLPGVPLEETETPLSLKFPVPAAGRVEADFVLRFNFYRDYSYNSESRKQKLMNFLLSESPILRFLLVCESLNQEEDFYLELATADLLLKPLVQNSSRSSSSKEQLQHALPLLTSRGEQVGEVKISTSLPQLLSSFAEEYLSEDERQKLGLDDEANLC